MFALAMLNKLSLDDSFRDSTINPISLSRSNEDCLSCLGMSSEHTLKLAAPKKGRKGATASSRLGSRVTGLISRRPCARRWQPTYMEASLSRRGRGRAVQVVKRVRI